MLGITITLQNVAVPRMAPGVILEHFNEKTYSLSSPFSITSPFFLCACDSQGKEYITNLFL